MERATRSVFILRASPLMKVSGPRRAYLIGTIDLFDPPTPLRPSRSLKRLRKSVWKESWELAQRRVALLAPGTVAAPLCRSADSFWSRLALLRCNAATSGLFLACVASTVAQVRRRTSLRASQATTAKKKSCDLQFLPFVRFSDVTTESLFAGFSSPLCLMRMMLGFFFSFLFQGFERLDGLIDTIEYKIANPRLCFFN